MGTFWKLPEASAGAGAARCPMTGRLWLLAACWGCECPALLRAGCGCWAEAGGIAQGLYGLLGGGGLSVMG